MTDNPIRFRDCDIAPLSPTDAGDHFSAVTPARDLTEAAIGELVRNFYGRARRDPVIGPVVTDCGGHLQKLCDFCSSVMLTTGRYKGNPMAAHMKHPIEPAFFERWLSLWTQTAHALFAPAVAALFVEKAQRIGENLQLALFYRPASVGGAKCAQAPNWRSRAHVDGRRNP